jgi:predicted AAA+ superfamily ATPase
MQAEQVQARQLLAQRGDAVILDLQDRADRARLQEPELFFEAHRHQLVCLDEIQLLPEFFSLLRAEIDRDRWPGRFLLLGSASGPLLRQSHESMAGRIAQELTPFLLKEVAQAASWQQQWLRGGARRACWRQPTRTASTGARTSSALFWVETSHHWSWVCPCR